MKTNKLHDINECFYLYYKHNQGRTIKVLAEEVSLSESTVNRRIKHAKQIIVNNYSGMTLKIPLSHLNIAKPNNFIFATNSLYLTSHKICNLTIALYQSYGINEIEYQNLIKVGPQLKNKNRIKKTILDLKNLTIYDPSYGEIKMYENIYYDNSVMKYKFSQYSLFYIMLADLFARIDSNDNSNF